MSFHKKKRWKFNEKSVYLCTIDSIDTLKGSKTKKYTIHNKIEHENDKNQPKLGKILLIITRL